METAGELPGVDSPASNGGSAVGSPPKEGGSGKRRKTQRACHHCQKAHLTCDDARPCGRCVKRGLAETCADGARKKAKYLRDFEEALIGRPSGDASMPVPPSATEPTQPQFSLNTSTASLVPPQLVYDSTLSPAARLQGAVGPGRPPVTATPPDLGPFFASTDFGSEAAGFEYAILSSMLNGGGFSTDSPIPIRNGAPTSQSASSNTFLGTLTEPAPFLSMDGYPAASGSPSAPVFTSAVTAHNGYGSAVSAPESALRTAPDPSPASPQQASKQPARARPKAPITRPPGQASTSDEVYRNVTKPYRYTDSYHFLIRHLKERFEKNDILRVVRALAIYRPSLIALQMPLTEEDEIFVEKCFQRTVIELDRLISFSGTPTVVWRRTGEISCVGTEFCLLTEWTREQLLSKKKFIYELFDTSSTVEYYEAFATHAFENTTQAVMTSCVLLTPKGRPVPCTCCFTIKRDLFNCPSLVIGSFLPILSG